VVGWSGPRSCRTDSSKVTVRLSASPQSKRAVPRLGAEIAYAGASFEPFVGGTFEYDFIAIETTVGAGTPVPDDDRSGGVVNIGARYFNNNGISASLQYSTLLARGTLSEHSVDLFVRMDFD